jgi:hypothetical protein
VSRLLRIALHAYPRMRRERDGAVLLDCAAELMASGSSSGAREAAGLARAGLYARLGAARDEVRAAPWGPALERLALPLAAANLGWWLVGASSSGAPLGRWWLAMLACAGLALLGALTRRRSLSLAGWGGTALLLAQTLIVGETNQTIGSRFDADIGNVSLDLAAGFAPVVLLGLLAAGHVRGEARFADLVWLAPPIALLGVPAPEPATGVLLAGLFAAPVAMLLLARGDRVRLAMAAALTAAAAPEAIWLCLYPIPYPGPTGALAVLTGLGAAAALAVAAVARRAGRSP